jgi:hypothetical protein
LLSHPLKQAKTRIARSTKSYSRVHVFISLPEL